MELDVLSMCQAADGNLNRFISNLHIDVLDLYKNNPDDGKEKNDVAELPQVIVNTYIIILIDLSCWLLLNIFCYLLLLRFKAIGQLLRCIPGDVTTTKKRITIK